MCPKQFIADLLFIKFGVIIYDIFHFLFILIFNYFRQVEFWIEMHALCLISYHLLQLLVLIFSL